MESSGLGQVAQHVEDLDRAVAFYRDVLGLRLVTRFDPPGLAFFDLGPTRLLLEANAPASLLYLRVDELGPTVEVLRSRGVVIESEPHVIHVDEEGLFGSAGQVEEMAFIRDSENNIIGLMARNPPAEG